MLNDSALFFFFFCYSYTLVILVSPATDPPTPQAGSEKTHLGKRNSY